jgi:hypothetical protein
MPPERMKAVTLGSGSGVAGVITQGMVKQFVVRKGFEAAVKKAFRTATH